MLFWINLYILLGWFVGLVFFIVLDNMLKETRDKNGAKNIKELIYFSSLEESQGININALQTILLSSLFIAVFTFWPILLIILIWMFTWI